MYAVEDPIGSDVCPHNPDEDHRPHGESEDLRAPGRLSGPVTHYLPVSPTGIFFKKDDLKYSRQTWSGTSMLGPPASIGKKTILLAQSCSHPPHASLVSVERSLFPLVFDNTDPSQYLYLPLPLAFGSG